MVLKGQISLGQLIAFRIISGYVTQPLLRLSTVWQNIQELKISFERLADIINTKKEIDDLEKNKILMPKINGFVNFQNVYFKFKKENDFILNGVNLSIKPNSFIGIVGQSGSGKSTLMKLLYRLYSPDDGKILIDGYDIKKVELKSLRNQIGVVPQDPLLFKGSVRENIALRDYEISEEEIIKVSKIACAHDFIMELPNGYSTLLNEKGSSLSGGQRQRITLARTLLYDPKILILDEATSSLDYSTEKKVCNSLFRNSENKTIFFVTHRLSTIKNANLIIVFHKGRIAELGTHDELIEKRGRYFALLQESKET
jgi:ATP-binding cassette subfamily B protein